MKFEKSAYVWMPPARVVDACTRPKKLSCKTFGSPPGLNVRSAQSVAARELELPDQNGCKARKRDTDRNSKCIACWQRKEKAAQKAQRVNMMHVVIGFYPREGRYFGIVSYYLIYDILIVLYYILSYYSILGNFLI